MSNPSPSPFPSASSGAPSAGPSAGPSPSPSASGAPIAGQTPLNYFLWFIAFVCAQASSMWGQFVTLKYPNMGMFAAYKMAIPFAWLDWLFMSVAVNIGDKYKLVTPTQDTFTLITLQFTAILIINHFYLHQPLFRSDIIAFFIILFGFAVSFNNMLSKALNRPVPTAVPAPSATPSSATPGPSKAPVALKGDRKKVKLLKKIWGIQPTNDYSILNEGFTNNVSTGGRAKDSISQQILHVAEHIPSGTAPPPDPNVPTRPPFNESFTNNGFTGGTQPTIDPNAPTRPPYSPNEGFSNASKYSNYGAIGANPNDGLSLSHSM